MASRINPKLKYVGLAAIVGVLGFAANYGLTHSTFNIGKVGTVQTDKLKDFSDNAATANVKPVKFPTTVCVTSFKGGRVLRGRVWEWSSQQGLFFANGGKCTTKGSLMETAGVSLALTRQDDTGKMAADLIKGALGVKNGNDGSDDGADFVIIMGDGVPNFVATYNGLLKTAGLDKNPDYALKVIGAVGFSRGEDACMVPPNLRDAKSIASTPMFDSEGNQLPVTGLLIDAVLRDGDYNICAKWAADNGLYINPDEKTFARNAINWLNAPDYNVAASDYVTGNKCEDRKEVSDEGHPGKFTLTGKPVHVCVNGVATWTPGDVVVATQRGGLVKIADSAKYRSQMPGVVIGTNKIFRDNADEVTAMLGAAFKGGDQLKAFPEALRQASRISAAIYDDQGGCKTYKKSMGKDTSECLVQWSDGEYWFHYFHPVQQNDKQGMPITLGGSAVNNLADNVKLFGLDGGNDVYAATYNVFASVDKQQYPDLFKDGTINAIPDVKSVVDKRYLLALVANGGDDSTAGKADEVNYNNVGSNEVVSKKDVNIAFATGSATLTPKGEADLLSLKNDLTISSGLRIQIDGYTDNAGDSAPGGKEKNETLSQLRADAVKAFLMRKGGFPEARFEHSTGHGSDNPVADNSTPEGKTKNRRVTITQVD